MPADPTITDPGLYRVIFENDRVRVLDTGTGPVTGPRHGHPDTVMVTLSAFSRRLHGGDGPPAGGGPLGPGT